MNRQQRRAEKSASRTGKSFAGMTFDVGGGVADPQQTGEHLELRHKAEERVNKAITTAMGNGGDLSDLVIVTADVNAKLARIDDDDATNAKEWEGLRGADGILVYPTNVAGGVDLLERVFGHEPQTPQLVRKLREPVSAGQVRVLSLAGLSIGLTVARVESRTADEDVPRVREMADGGYALNPAASLRWFAECEESEFKPGDGLALWRRFMAKFHTAMAAERIVSGREPDVQSVLNTTFRLHEFTEVLKRTRGDFVAAINAVLESAS